MNTTAKINRFLLIIIAIYLLFLLIVSSIACYYAYRQKKDQLLASLNLAMTHMDLEYCDILDNFWQVYMPFFEYNSTISDVFTNYFYDSEELTPMQHWELGYALEQILRSEIQGFNGLPFIPPGARQITFSCTTTPESVFWMKAFPTGRRCCPPNPAEISMLPVTRLIPLPPCSPFVPTPPPAAEQAEES